MKAFISYSHNDEAALERLHVHLAMLKREGLIETWFDREILAGGEIDAEINDQLESSDFFLLLVSPDFLASDYCYEKEKSVPLRGMTQAKRKSCRSLSSHATGNLRLCED